jgi:hypothetical protein
MELVSKEAPRGKAGHGHRPWGKKQVRRQRRFDREERRVRNKIVIGLAASSSGDNPKHGGSPGHKGASIQQCRLLG